MSEQPPSHPEGFERPKIVPPPSPAPTEPSPVDAVIRAVGPPSWIRHSIFLWWGTGAVLFIAFRMLNELRGLLIQIVLGLFLSFAIEPLVDAMQRRGIGRSLATIISLLGVIIGSVGFVAIMGSMLAEQLNELVDDMPAYIESTQSWLNANLGLELSADDLLDQFRPGGEGRRIATDLAGNLVGVGTTLASVLFQALTILLFSYYFAADGPRLREQVCSLFPPDRQHEILRVWELAVNKTGAYISSRFILATLSAVAHWIVFTLLNMPSSVALAIWVGLISQFIPTIGTYIAGVLPIMVAFGVRPSTALWVLLTIIVYQQIENYIFQPRITAQTLDMHPAVSIAAVLGGTALLGAPGAFLALPLVATASGFATAYIHRHEVVTDAKHSRYGRRRFRAGSSDAADLRSAPNEGEPDE